MEKYTREGFEQVSEEKKQETITQAYGEALEDNVQLEVQPTSPNHLNSLSHIAFWLACVGFFPSVTLVVPFVGFLLLFLFQAFLISALLAGIFSIGLLCFAPTNKWAWAALILSVIDILLPLFFTPEETTLNLLAILHGHFAVGIGVNW